MNGKNPIQKRAAEIVGVSFLALALFLILALGSYSPLDPSLRRFAPENPSVHNLTGPVGSYIADTLIWFVGIGVLWLPAMILVVALRYFRQPQYRIGTAVIVGTAGLVFATSGVFTLLIGRIEFYGVSLLAGGLLGKAVAGLLDAHFRLAGSLIVLILIMVIALLILFEFSLVAFAQKMVAGTGTLLGRLWEGLRKKPKAPTVSEPPPPPSSRKPGRKASRKSCRRRNRRTLNSAAE